MSFKNKSKQQVLLEAIVYILLLPINIPFMILDFIRYIIFYILGIKVLCMI